MSKADIIMQAFDDASCRYSRDELSAITGLSRKQMRDPINALLNSGELVEYRTGRAQVIGLPERSGMLDVQINLHRHWPASRIAA